MGSQQILLGQGGKTKLYREDLFNSLLFEGNGSSSRSINMGVDLAGAGGMVWTKDIDDDDDPIHIFNTVSGTQKLVNLNDDDAASTTSDGISAWTGSGYTTGNKQGCNGNNKKIMSYTFRKEPNFMDIQVVNSNSETAFMVNHNLGCKPGFIMMRRVHATSGGTYGGNWYCWHKDIAQTQGNNQGSADELHFKINKGNNEVSSDDSYEVGRSASATQVRVPNGSEVNGSNHKILIILFASHEGSTDHPNGEFGEGGNANIIRCGYYTGNNDSGTGGPEINLGWDPEFLMIGRMHGTYASDNNIFCQTRGMYNVFTEYMTYAMRITEDYTGPQRWSYAGPAPMHNGFIARGTNHSINSNQSHNGPNKYWYLAIRRADGVVGKMKDIGASTNRHDFSRYTQTSEPVVTENFRIDATLFRKPTAEHDTWAGARVNGSSFVETNKYNNEMEEGDLSFHSGTQNQAHKGNMTSGGDTWFMNWLRCDTFDCFNYKGNGNSNREVTHNMGLAPEMLWIKAMDQSGAGTNANQNTASSDYGWACWHEGLNGGGNNAIGELFQMNTQNNHESISNIFKSIPTANNFYIGDHNRVNENNKIYNCWAFASKAGVSKIGHFDSQGSSGSWIDIDLGFNPRTLFIFKDGDGWKYMQSVAYDWGSNESNNKVAFYPNQIRNTGAYDATRTMSNGFQFNATNSSMTWLYYAHS